MSQGIDLDIVHVKLLKSLFMVEDLTGEYAAWVQG